MDIEHHQFAIKVLSQLYSEGLTEDTTSVHVKLFMLTRDGSKLEEAPFGNKLAPELFLSR